MTVIIKQLVLTELFDWTSGISRVLIDSNDNVETSNFMYGSALQVLESLHTNSHWLCDV